MRQFGKSSSLITNGNSPTCFGKWLASGSGSQRSHERAFSMNVPVDLNKLVFDYDQVIIVGPVFPHESAFPANNIRSPV